MVVMNIRCEEDKFAHASEKGPVINGPMPSPRTKRLIIRIVDSRDTWNSAAIPCSVKDAFKGTNEQDDRHRRTFNIPWTKHR
jgi:hypothetical protein